MILAYYLALFHVFIRTREEVIIYFFYFTILTLSGVKAFPRCNSMFINAAGMKSIFILPQPYFAI